jgi:hypothetical protein
MLVSSVMAWRGQFSFVALPYPLQNREDSCVRNVERAPALLAPPRRADAMNLVKRLSRMHFHDAFSQPCLRPSLVVA